MAPRGLHLDHPMKGSRYSDRMHRILGACHSCGILWHEERLSYRDGRSEVCRITDVRAAGDEPQITDRYEKYGLYVNPRVLPRIRKMGSQFAYSLNVPETTISVEGDVVYVRVPLEDGRKAGPLLYEHAWDMAPELPRGGLLLGVDEQRQQLLLDLAAPRNVHALVAGRPGSGKSTLMKTMALSALMTGGVKVALFDLSGGLYDLSGHPAVWRGGMFGEADDCERGLGALARQAERGKVEGGQLLYCFVDEALELIRRKPEVGQYLGSLAQAGRHAGIHLVLGVQHPTAAALGAATLHNIPVRIIGQVADVVAAYGAAGRGKSEAQTLMGAGDFIIINGSMKERFQAAMPSLRFLDDWAQRYPPRAPRIPPQARLATPADLLDTTPARMGRTVEQPDDRVVAWARQYLQDNGQTPALNEIDRFVTGLLGHGYTRRKQRAVLDMVGALDRAEAGET